MRCPGERTASNGSFVLSPSCLQIKKHPFFASLDWGKMARKEITPPYKPDVKNPKKAELFDSEFTEEAAQLTPIDPQLVAAIEQSEFNAFSFVKRGAFGMADGGEAVETREVDINDLTQYTWCVGPFRAAPRCHTCPSFRIFTLH